GGTWTSSSSAVAGIASASGIVTGVSSGTATISYTLGTLGAGCYTTATVTVNPNPSAITGTTVVCVGNTTTLSDPTGSGSWTSSNSTIAPVGISSGVVTGGAAGTATITYTASSGCFALTTVTVQSATAISGTLTVCAGTATTLTNSSPGGTWSSSNTSVATVGSVSGIVTGVSAGTATITYTLTGGCYVTAVVTVNAPPAAITGPNFICPGGNVILSNTTGGGTWTSSNTGVATIDPVTGGVTGVATGTTVITYNAGGCYVTTTFTVVPTPTSITGISQLCVGSSSTFTDGVPGGTWLSSSPSIASTGFLSGVVTGVSSGSATISYTLGSGCTVTMPVTINAHPTPIYGAGAICLGAVDSFYDYTPGGIWSSSNSAIAPVSTTGMVSGLSGGLATITYTSSSTGCYATWAVSVLVIPAITGLHNLCAWVDTMTISDADTGGLFSSTSVTVTNYSAGVGFVHSAAPGTAIIEYTLPLGCTVSDTITVNPLPGLITAVSGSLLDCAGTTVTLSDIPIGGTWTSGNTAVATIGSSSGVITPVSSGIARITYTSPVGCRADTVFLNNPTPDSINGANTFLCPGATITLYDTIPGGTWSSSNPAIATVNTYSGVVSGISGGVVTITYTVCSHTMLATVTVSPIPAISGDTLLCAGATIALTDGASGGTWSSSNPAAGTIDPSGDITGISAGSTIITYMVTPSCYATLPVSISGAGGSCGPCMVFHTYHRLGLSGLITSNVGPGNYSVTNNVTVQGNVTFDSAVIMVGPGDTIFVDTSSTLTVDSSHIFSLCSEWQGLWLKPGYTHSGKAFIKKHSLIEDALCGVFIPHAVPPASGNIFESQASVFNRNKVGIAIQFYNDTLANYPFLIHNTVITSRDFSAYPGYPGDWPATMGPRGLKTYLAPPDTFTAPFNVMSYPYAACYSSDPQYGIELDSVANYYLPTTPVGLILPFKYSGITIGDLTVTANDSNQNLIDEQKFGVWAINSNLTCENNAFTNMLPAQWSFSMPTGTISSPTGGDAIYAACTNDLTNPNKLWVSSPPTSPYNNLFYGFTNAIECSNYLQVLVRRIYAITAHTTYGSGIYVPGGQTGILIKTAKYDTIDIDHNTIFNTSTGISLNMSYDPTVWTTVYGRSGGLSYAYSVSTPSQYMDLCTINNNLLQAQPDRSASFSNIQMNLGISYQNPIIFHPSVLGSGTTVVTYAHDLDMYDNTIQDAYSGIYVNNYAASRYNAYLSLNTISLRQPSSSRQLSYGINNTICNNSVIYQNTISGAQPSAASADNMRAVYMNNNTTDAVGCNIETQLGRGFEYFMNNPHTDWYGNNMSNNLKGFVLNGGVIGPQDDSGTTGAPYSDNDVWSGSWSVGSNWQTYVNNANPVSSALWSLPGMKPTVNGSAGIRQAYGIDTNSLRTTNNPGGPCIYMPPPPNDVYLAEQMAEQHVNYVYNTVPANWIAQYALWKMTVFDTAMVDSSAVVQQFQHMADSMSRFRYLTDIETALNDGNLTVANALLSVNVDLMVNTAYDSATGVRIADDSATDFIVQNYQQFYRLYINYETGVFSTEDSTQLFALAQLCPEVNGTVIYQARALYSGIFNDYSMYNDDSCMNADSSYVGERHGETAQNGTQNEQEYILWPNPNNGSISLVQTIPDSKPVTAEIWNEVGMEVYRDNSQFSGGRDQLHMINATPGLYLLRLTDCKNRVFTLKFVVQ
ncbi:MAG: hypothetical protein JST19_07805, partial [Bacteroidetes bacterium]|nr:hypothetical protein [Bacteroidota bacterium]